MWLQRVKLLPVFKLIAFSLKMLIKFYNHDLYSCLLLLSHTSCNAILQLLWASVYFLKLPLASSTTTDV